MRKVFIPQSCINLIQDDSTILEKEPMRKAASMKQMKAYRHEGFWQCMDTVREKEYLEKLWSTNQAPWKVWN